MNVKLSGLVFPLFFVFYCGYAQKPAELLEKWAAKHPIEKIYLHFDRESYMAGETAWFKAYLSSDYLPDTISTSLYAELLNRDGYMIDRQVIPVIAGTAAGQFDLPDSLGSDLYFIRAYTAAMHKNSSDFSGKKDLLIFGNRKEASSAVTGQKFLLDFFPEGGNLVTGFTNNVAFKAVNENGYPAPVKGVIKNSKGTVITDFNSYHDGMGLFELMPVAGEKYYAETHQQKTWLPDPVEKGISLNMIQHQKGFFYEIQQRKDDPLFTVAYFVGQMQHHIVFQKNLDGMPGSLEGIVNTQQLRSGILQVTFFNNAGMPLAERLWFVNNKEYVQPLELLTDTIDLRSRARNRFRISMKDTVVGNISVAVVDAAYETMNRKENILTGLLLTSDLKGYIHEPSFYFSGPADSVHTATDLLMMTNGWRRFKWTGLEKQVEEKPVPSAYITLSGRAVLRGTNKAFSDKALLLLIKNTQDSKKRSTHMLQTDKNGNFWIDSLLFFDKNLLLFSDVRGRKSLYIDVDMGKDSLHRTFPWKENAWMQRKHVTPTSSSKWEMDYEAILKAKGIMMEGVVVKAQKKSPLEIIDDKYTRGMFSGDAVRSIDLVNSDEAMPYNNIFDYLQGRVSGLQIIPDGAEYGIYYRQNPTISSLGNPPMTLFLDEIETDVSVIASIPANQVAYVKMYSTFIGAAGGGPGGALAIYTKKSEDYGKSGNYANIAFYKGYSIAKEFYAPDHKIPDPAGKADHRITIDWRPSIFINSINPRLPVSFYNSDRTKRLKVVVEGMTTSGKLIWLEKFLQ